MKLLKKCVFNSLLGERQFIGKNSGKIFLIVIARLYRIDYRVVIIGNPENTILSMTYLHVTYDTR